MFFFGFESIKKIDEKLSVLDSKFRQDLRSAYDELAASIKKTNDSSHT